MKSPLETRSVYSITMQQHASLRSRRWQKLLECQVFHQRLRKIDIPVILQIILTHLRPIELLNFCPAHNEDDITTCWLADFPFPSSKRDHIKRVPSYINNHARQVLTVLHDYWSHSPSKIDTFSSTVSITRDTTFTQINKQFHIILSTQYLNSTCRPNSQNHDHFMFRAVFCIIQPDLGIIAVIFTHWLCQGEPTHFGTFTKTVGVPKCIEPRLSSLESGSKLFDLITLQHKFFRWHFATEIQ